MMTFDKYQKETTETIQSYNSKDQENYFLGYLGLAGEAGSVLTTVKKFIRDGEGFGSFKENLKEELGDVLWYIAAIATHNKISLSDIAEANILKTRDRFLETALLELPRFDENYLEKFPDTFTVEFIEEKNDNNLMQVRMMWKMENDIYYSNLGDPLTDNSKFPNNYRYHDVFHFGHIAFLGWSPVMRDLMRLKRRSNESVLECEDRGRTQVAEEAVTLFVYNYAKSNKMLKESDRIDTEIINTVKQLVTDLEVSSVSGYQWELTILESYKVFHKVVENKGGKVEVSVKNRTLTYLGK